MQLIHIIIVIALIISVILSVYDTWVLATYHKPSQDIEEFEVIDKIPDFGDMIYDPYWGVGYYLKEVLCDDNDYRILGAYPEGNTLYLHLAPIKDLKVIKPVTNNNTDQD